MAKATLTIASKNYGSWSLRGWLLCKMAGLDFEEAGVPSDDPSTRAELLLLSPSFLVPCLTHDGVKIWDTLAIAEYLNELKPERRPDAGGARRARALPLDLGRDAFRLQQSALGAADESQGALSGLQGLGRRAGRHRPHRHDLARMPGRIPAGPICSARAVHGGRHVRAGRHALSSPTTSSSTRPARPIARPSWRCRSCRNGSRPPRAEPDELEELDVEF